MVDAAARVTIRQSYRNLETVPLEVVYTFPLDEGAAVCGFEATVDGVRYVGRAMERDEAFKEYDDALEAGHGGFLLDEERADVFTASLGNLKPGVHRRAFHHLRHGACGRRGGRPVHAAHHGVATLRAGRGPERAWARRRPRR